MDIQDFSRIIIYEDIEKTGANWLKFFGKAKGMLVNPNKARLARRSAKAISRKASFVASKAKKVPVSKMDIGQVSALRNRRSVLQQKLRSSGQLSSKARLKRPMSMPKVDNAQSAKQFWTKSRKITAGTIGGAGAIGSGVYAASINRAPARKNIYHQPSYMY